MNSLPRMFAIVEENELGRGAPRLCSYWSMQIVSIRASRKPSMVCISIPLPFPSMSAKELLNIFG